MGELLLYAHDLFLKTVNEVRFVSCCITVHLRNRVLYFTLNQEKLEF